MVFHLKVLKPLWVATVFGFLVSLATGVIENPPEVSIVGAKYYGHPLVWRISMITLNASTLFKFNNFVIDAVFWTTVSFLAFIVLRNVSNYFQRAFNR